MEFQSWVIESYLETVLYDYQAGPVNDYDQFDVFGRPLYPELVPAPWNL
jgi:hypothetical protein